MTSREQLQQNILQTVTSNPDLVGNIEVFNSLITSLALDAGFVAVQSPSLGAQIDLGFIRGRLSTDPNTAFTAQLGVRVDGNTRITGIFGGEAGIDLVSQTTLANGGSQILNASITANNSMLNGDFDITIRINAGTNFKIAGLTFPTKGSLTGAISYEFVDANAFLDGPLKLNAQQSFRQLNLDFDDQEFASLSEAFLKTASAGNIFDLEAYVAIRNFELSDHKNDSIPSSFFGDFDRAVQATGDGGYVVMGGRQNGIETVLETVRFTADGGISSTLRVTRLQTQS